MKNPSKRYTDLVIRVTIETDLDVAEDAAADAFVGAVTRLVVPMKDGDGVVGVYTCEHYEDAPNATAEALADGIRAGTITEIPDQHIAHPAVLAAIFDRDGDD